MKFRIGDALKRPGVFVGLAFLAVYRRLVSPVLHAVFGRDGFCRFSPTCSEYARQALLTHGFFAGTLLAAWRIFRCNPFCAGGFDPVPAPGEPFFRRMRVGIFGGSFDPVHNVHLALAEAAAKTLRLDRVIFVPAAHSPLKSEVPSAPAELRVEMLRAALENVPAAEVSTWEIEQGGKSFSFNTVRHFRETLPRADFFWIFGADQLAQLDRWHEAEALCREVAFVAMRRDADALPPVPAALKGFARVIPLTLPRADLSSTEIRQKIAAGDLDGLRGCLPWPVLAIILKNNLYAHGKNEKDDDAQSRGGNETCREDSGKSESARRSIEADKAFRGQCWNDR